MEKRIVFIRVICHIVSIVSCIVVKPHIRQRRKINQWMEGIKGFLLNT